MRWPEAAASALLALLAACQPLPRPFAPDPGAPPNPLLTLADAPGVVVLAVDGLDEEPARRFATAMAHALKRRNLPAMTGGGNRESRFLLGAAATRARGDGRLDVHLTWDVFDREGSLLGTRAQDVPVPAAEWARQPAALHDRLAEAAAPSVAALLQAPQPRAVTAHGLPPVRVLRVDGAPGDGDAALRRTLEDALTRAGAPLVRQETAGEVRVSGRVAVGPPHFGLRPVEVVWSVAAEDGAAIGEVRQANGVPEATVEGAWGETAEAIAEAAAGGVLDLLARGAPSR